LTTLCECLISNTTFKGGIDISNNALTDESSIVLAKLIKSNKNIK